MHVLWQTQKHPESENLVCPQQIQDFSPTFHHDGEFVHKKHHDVNK
jgi:hypothetical protein